jgi:ATP-dependent phosphofructokinase / diphosphate-dependent phosphofructokinase
MRIGLLTGGGDCPGLNALIRGVVKQSSLHGNTLVGFRHGWRGVVDGDLFPLTRDHVRGVLNLGGTMLGTARFHPHEDNGGIEAVLDTLRRERIDSLICIGGDGTLHAAGKLAEAGVGMVCAPKTIDNDVWGTDRSVGFDTAVSIATEAIDRVHTTAESHDRVMVVEVMGHHVGWIAIAAGIAGGADQILIPEDPFDIDEIAASLRHRHRSYASSSIVVVAEGATAKPGTLDFTPPEGPFGSIVAGAIGERIKVELQERTGFDTRVTILGHVQRGGTPTANDRLLASRFGVAAADAAQAGATSVMTALVGDRIELVDIADVAGRLKTVPEDLRRVAASLY